MAYQTFISFYYQDSWRLKLINNNETLPMHTRINSLLNQHKANKRTDKHSTSHSKKHKNFIDQSSQLFAPEHFITDFLTFPMTTQINQTSKAIPKEKLNVNKRKSKTKKGHPQKSKSIGTKNKKSKSKDKKSDDKNPIQHRISKQSIKKARLQQMKRGRNIIDPFCKYNSSKKLSPDCLSKAFKITRANSKQTKPVHYGQNYEEILEEYGEFLTVQEISQIKEYKNIYFLGKIKSRKNKKLFSSSKKTPKSARQKLNKSSQKQEKIEISNMLTQRKVDDNEGQGQNSDSQFYKYEIGDHIAYRYQIIESVGSGAFGQVIKVYDHKSKQHQVLKIVRKCQELVKQTLVQITILAHIRQNDKKDLSGIVKLKDFTIFRQHICIAFELLQGNLYEFVATNNHCGLTENAIRNFALQLLNSLSFLKQEHIIHCDLKPENIVMKKWGKSGIKLVDFGTSCFQGKQIYEYIQSRFYRSPEIILHKPYSFPIDMWSLGCILAQLKLGEPLFPANNDTQHLLYISKSIGLPRESDGQYSTQFLESEQLQNITEKYYLDQYELIKDKEEVIKEHPFFSKCKYIKNSMKTLRQRLTDSKSDGKFYEFISKILVWQPEKRLKPQEALQDPWIVQGIPKEIKQIYTFFTSRDKSKQSKHKNSNSKSKSKGSKSKGKEGKAKSKGRKDANKSTLFKPKDGKHQTKPVFSAKTRQNSLQLPSKRSVLYSKKEKKCIF